MPATMDSTCTYTKHCIISNSLVSIIIQCLAIFDAQHILLVLILVLGQHANNCIHGVMVTVIADIPYTVHVVALQFFVCFSLESVHYVLPDPINIDM